MNELIEYLKAEYPEKSKAYYLLILAFTNDYHRRCRDAILSELYNHNKEKAGDILMSKVIGYAIMDVYDWLRHLDVKLYNLTLDKQSRELFVDYLGAKPLLDGSDKVADVIHGEGYTERLKETIRKSIAG